MCHFCAVSAGVRHTDAHVSLQTEPLYLWEKLMGTLIEKFLNQLAVLLWGVLAGKVRARLELELAATQSELLEQAAACRREHGELGEPAARRLEAASEKIAIAAENRTEDSPDGRTVPLLRIKSAAGKSGEDANKRGRGRPRKATGEPAAVESAPEMTNGALPQEPSHED
jgi:hypothetical protein